MSEEVKIPVVIDGKVFYNDKFHLGLKECQDSGFRAWFIPEIEDLRSISDKESFIWQKWHASPSVRVTGQTKGGNNVVAYAHVPNYFSNPQNIEKAIKEGLENGAGHYPEKQFYKLLDMEDGANVFVIDYDALKNSESGVMSISEAMKHPQTIAFIGGKERTEKYLDQHEKVVGKKIGNYHSDDLHDKPFGRPLVVGNFSNSGYLLGDYNFNGDGRFDGVPVSAEGATREKTRISPLEKLAGKATNAGDGILVIKREQLTDTEYNLLTRK